ncbi:MAG: endolytic transglycosylase MltG [Coriobacteriales bacterium]|nr:endolytic transglycosylase MltG [Coriobacteriales bacterium]
MPTSHDAEGQRKSKPKGAGRPNAASSAQSGSGQRRAHAGSAGEQRRVPSGNTGEQRRVPSGNTGAQRRVSPSDTSSRRRVAADSTGSHHRSSPADTTASLSTAPKNKKRLRANNAAGFKSAAHGTGDYHPSHAAAPKRKGLPVWLIVLIVVAVAIVGVGGFFLARVLMPASSSTQVAAGQEVTVVIPEGATGTDIVNILLEQGVIKSKSDFKKALKAQNADQSLHSGAYTFVTGSDASEVVAQLVAGPNSNHGQLQIPEGLTITQTAKLVESALSIPKDEFIAQAKASNYLDDYSFLKEAGDDSLEGFLYPKTYDCAGKEINADTVIRMMLTQYEQEMNDQDLSGAKTMLSDRYNLSVTTYDIIKIASIIEKEAINEDDRPKVSSVFYNRLSQNIAIQSDATMGYVTGGEVSTDDLSSDSPYNTYYYKGLPPTPICSPSLWAIQAAMNPADTKYLFFFIIEDDNYSNHTFSETYEEHQAAFSAALAEQKAAAEAAAGGKE